MKINKTFRILEPLLVAMFWLFLFTLPFLLNEGSRNWSWTKASQIWINQIPYLVVFFINRYVLLPYLLFKDKKAYFLISAVSLVILVSFFAYFKADNNANRPAERPVLREFGTPPPRQGQASRDEEGQRPFLFPGAAANRKPDGKPFPMFLSALILSVLIIGFDTGIRSYIRWSKSEREKMRLEKEHAETQLAFLRHQVSPHFFMNTLNNIHALIDFNAESAKESVIRLSKLMRHLLYECDIERIAIAKEVGFINNYMELMKLRFTEMVTLETDIPHNVPDKKIPPLIFISYIENAFKHGISYTKPSFVKVKMQFESDKLEFEITNSNHAKKTGHPSGIGLENARQRLNLVLGETYNLSIQSNDEIFTVHLSIPI